MRAVYQENRIWWGIVLALLLCIAGAVSTWYWYASRPKPPPAGATLVGTRAGVDRVMHPGAAGGGDAGGSV